MANIKSAIKRIKTSAKKKTRNGLVLAPAKSAYKKANKALANSDEKSLETVKTAIKNIDKAKSKGLIHKNKAARQKQKLQLKLNKLGK